MAAKPVCGVLVFTSIFTSAFTPAAFAQEDSQPGLGLGGFLYSYVNSVSDTLAIDIKSAKPWDDVEDEAPIENENSDTSDTNESESSEGSGTVNRTAYTPESHHEDNKKLQQRLMDLYYMDRDEPTDYYGSATQQAVRYFQRKHGLTADGVAGPETIAALFAESAKVYTVTTETDGPDVEGIQARLKELGYPVDPTGYFGSDTEYAVKYFQRMNGLEDDGSVGEQTKELLYSKEAEPSLEYAQQQEDLANQAAANAQDMDKMDTGGGDSSGGSSNGSSGSGGSSSGSNSSSGNSSGGSSSNGNGSSGSSGNSGSSNNAPAPDTSSPDTSSTVTPETGTPDTGSSDNGSSGDSGSTGDAPAPSEDTTPSSKPEQSTPPAEPDAPTDNLEVSEPEETGSNEGEGNSGNSGNTGSEGSGNTGSSKPEKTPEPETVPIEEPKPEPTKKPESNVSANAGDVESFINVALAQVGKKYVRGGKGPNSFDCSGFVYYALNQSGNKIGYMTSGGWAGSGYKTISSMGDLQRGDVICFKGHVGIYLGGNEMVDASSSNGKVVRRSMGDWSRRNFICGKRPL